MSDLREKQKAWLGQVKEEIIDPDRGIVDPHHHLWKKVGGAFEVPPYLLEDLWDDTQAGHKIEKTVFIECGAEYYEEGPDHLKPVGETVFVEELASASRGHGKAEIAAIIAHADLTGESLDEVLDAHGEAGKGLFRGIRHAGAFDNGTAGWLGTSPEDLYLQEAFQKGVARLGQRGLTYDSWHYHYQNANYLELAKAVPGTQMILDHFGAPVNVSLGSPVRDEVMAMWKKDIAAIAECDNVVAKLGGLAMPPNGFGWDQRETPASSDELLESQRDFYLYTIDCFGPERCMFESNFPVDKLSLSYVVYWNAMKKLVAEFSEPEKEAMFRGTATRVYKL